MKYQKKPRSIRACTFNNKKKNLEWGCISNSTKTFLRFFLEGTKQIRSTHAWRSTTIRVKKTLKLCYYAFTRKKLQILGVQNIYKIMPSYKKYCPIIPHFLAPPLIHTDYLYKLKISWVSSIHFKFFGIKLKKRSRMLKKKWMKGAILWQNFISN